MLLSSLAGSVGTCPASRSSHVYNASFYRLPARLFTCFLYVLEQEYISSFSRLWAFFCTMYEHVVVGHQIFYSTTQQSARTEPRSNYVPVRVRRRKQADRAHLLYCSTLGTAQHSTAQHSTAQSARTTPKRKHVPIRVRQRK